MYHAQRAWKTLLEIGAITVNTRALASPLFYWLCAQCESYLMWREETRQQDITEEARAKRAKRYIRSACHQGKLVQCMTHYLVLTYVHARAAALLVVGSDANVQPRSNSHAARVEKYHFLFYDDKALKCALHTLLGIRYRTPRESHELVMMRKEELMAREAWALEDSSLKHAIELWEHEARISFSRLNLPGAPSLREGEGRTKLPSAPGAKTREKKNV